MPDRASLTGRQAAALAFAAIAATALLLFLNRGTTFYLDETTWFAYLSRGFGLESVLAPHNSHLIGTSRILFAFVNAVAGPDYPIFRVAAVISVIACSALLWVWARQRIGDAWALLPAILILFFGSAWQHVVVPVGLPITASIAFGLAALLAVERRERRGDMLACLFVALSVFTYTVGLGYLVGVAISVLLRRDRFRRAWIFVIPLVLYAAWWVWAQQFDQSRTTIADPGYVVGFFSDSLAVASGAISGVAVPFSRFGESAPIDTAPPGPLGWIVAAAIVGAVCWRLLRGGYSSTIWSSLGVLSTYWLAAALSKPLFFEASADAIRYTLPGSVGVLLVLIDAADGLRPRGRQAAAILAVFAFSLTMNLAFLRDGAAYFRDHSVEIKGDLAMLELGNGWLPGNGPTDGDGTARYQLAETIPFLGYGSDRDEYLAAVADYGSPAFDLDEIRALPDTDRAVVDQALRQVYALALNPTANRPEAGSGCPVASSADGQFEVPVGGMYVRALGPQPVTMSANRFGPAPGVDLGTAERGSWSWVLMPTDPAPEPWQATVTAGKARVCPVPAPP